MRVGINILQERELMIFLSEKNKYVKEVIDEQKILPNAKYRVFKYISMVEEDSGIILLNNLTDEHVFLNESEKTEFFKLEDFSNDIIKFLIKNWFLVPEDFNDLEFSKELENTVHLIYRAYRKKEINSFTILTTTDCNARCFYCYQHGCIHKTMSRKTAEDVADYILKNKSDTEIMLRWFGGEPLYNLEAIDTISNILLENNVQFHSLMTTNGYLFDSELIEKAKNSWKLKQVQITLDGTEDIYNKVKAYIYKDRTNAFKKVTDNIELLLRNDVRVNVRMNMDEHNTKDLYELTDYILDRYKEYDNFYAYVHLLYENSCKQVINRDIEHKKILQEECENLNERIKNSSKLKGEKNQNKISHRVHRCMSDTDSSILILPDGKLGKCEHYLDDNYIGSIYDNALDLDLINLFKELVTVCEACDNCELRSRCRSLKKCPSTRTVCYDEDKEKRIRLYHERMRKIYYAQKNI